MKIKTIVLLASLVLLISHKIDGQEIIKNNNWEVSLSHEGSIKQLTFKNTDKIDIVPFFKEGDNIGPSFYIKDKEGKEEIGKWNKVKPFTYQAIVSNVECIMTYQTDTEVPSIKFTITNLNTFPFQPQKSGVKLGIDTYMDKYPEWFSKFFPTLMYCDETHFYGYLQTPTQQTLGVFSEQPIASWSVDYNLGYMDPSPHWFMGHRIESLNLDLINELPLPNHNPQHLYELKQGESKTWVISFVNVGDLSNYEKEMRKFTSIPLLNIAKTNIHVDEEITFEVFGKHPTIYITDDTGNKIATSLVVLEKDMYIAKTKLPKVGLYSVTVKDGDFIASATLLARNEWKWVLEKARIATIKHPQKATSHAESWYGFYSAFIAAKEFPNNDLDKQNSDRFEYLYNLLHKEEVPIYYASRIQNTSTTIGMLVDKYEAFGDLKDLERASKLGDWLIKTSQHKDGAYYNHSVIYTSVIYIAKSMLELAIAEKEASLKDKAWVKAYNRHYKSAKKAIDQLVASKGNFQTEGEHTFEDGMISCSALQIGMLATLESNKKDKDRYTREMLEILNSHDCLTQLKVVDSRRRQGTMRYWEAQYDVQMLPNMFNSPHGWSGWRAYATYYAYLLTGEEKWLQQTFNAMAAFSNLIDYQTGTLRWAFVIDPHLRVEQACSADTKVTHDDLSFGNPHPRLYETKHFTIGEQYVNMISDWQTINTQDNDVHELFKCIGETVLTNAFILEKESGELVGYNCSIIKEGNELIIESFESQIINLHVNLQNEYLISFRSPAQDIVHSKKAKKGFYWFTQP